jgi:1-aminocyclopropane-1-carboxylate deaminase/D-cysteine desulfhydrase-like pyridoxal-dependent ACC family enzyme
LSIECHLFLSGQTSEKPTGNLLLDCLAEAKVHLVSSLADRRPPMLAFAERLRSEGHEPYVIPIGGADAIGAHGCVIGFEELRDQVRLLSPKPTCLVFASSSGATYAGMLVGKARTGSEINLRGIRTDLDPNSEVVICSIANSLAERLGMTRRFQPKELQLNSDHVGEGFPIPTEKGIEALRQLWQLEGILLDPVYTAKAMAGLIDLAGKALWTYERVIFLHTGGTPTVFSFAELLSDSAQR